MLKSPKAAQIFRFLLLWIVVPNAAFVAFQQAYAIGRAANILLYPIVALVWPVIGTPATLVLYAGFYVADLLTTISTAFGIPVPDLLGGARGLGHLDLSAHGQYLLMAGLALAGLVLPPVLGWRRERRARQIPVGLAILVAASAAAADVAANTDLRYGARYAGYQYVSHLFSDADRVPTSALRASGLSRRLEANEGRSLLLVVVEALGVFHDEALNRRLFAALDDPAVAARYDVRHGTIVYDGSTTRAELRELCDRNDSYLSYLRRLPEGVSCLPGRLAAQGYRTVAVHGFTGSFFERERWYPVIGFQDSLFREQLADLPECGWVFPGACDRRVAEAVRRELAGAAPGRPALVYWLTLNSHVPVALDGADAAAFDCAGLDDPTTCTLARLWAEVLAAVRDIAADPALPPMDVLIVGDHAPPVPSRAARALFDHAHVPWIALAAKDRPVSARAGP